MHIRFLSVVVCALLIKPIVAADDLHLSALHSEPNERSEFGYASLKELKESAPLFDEHSLAERLHILLDHVEYYDEQALIPDCSITFGSFLPAAKQKEVFQKALEQRPKGSKQNIVRALRTQSMTGRSLRAQKVNLDTYYKQEIAKSQQGHEPRTELESINRMLQRVNV